MEIIILSFLILISAMNRYLVIENLALSAKQHNSISFKSGIITQGR